MPQPYTLNNYSKGIDRHRQSSPPTDAAFFDLVNCYLGPGHTIKRRSGLSNDQGLPGMGLTSFNGQLHTFYSGADPQKPAPVLGSAVSGALAATTYYVKYTYVSAAGETLSSAEVSLAVAANSVLTIASPPARVGATGWNAYVSTATGAETRQAANIAIGTNWQEPNTGLVAGAALPTSDTAGLLVQSHVLVCPDGSGSALSKVYFCEPLNGYLYVVAGFANGKTFHFYLDGLSYGTWTANTHLATGSIRQPVIDNGFHYQVTSGPADPAWSPGLEAFIGTTYVQPTTPNGYRYKCTATVLPSGGGPYTGNTEPVWPLVAGQTVTEYIAKNETNTTVVYRRQNLNPAEPADAADSWEDWKPGAHHAAGEVHIPQRLRAMGLGVVANYNNEGSLNVNYTGNTEPVWPNTAGQLVQDGTITWTTVVINQIVWTCVDDNTTGAAQPAWPTVTGGTVNDGTLTWTAIGKNVTDTSCPQTAGVIMGASKIFAIDPSGKVKFCATDNPRAWSTADGTWTTGTYYDVGDLVVDPNGYAQQCTVAGWAGGVVPSWATIANTSTVEAGNGAPTWLNVGIGAAGDAGYINTSLRSMGDTVPTVLGIYRGNLVVFTASGYQIWQIDTDPANNALLESFEGAGSQFLRSCLTIGTDMMFLNINGVRSMSSVEGSASLEPGDAGMPIDPLVTPNISAADTFSPFAMGLPGSGQYMLFVGQNVYVLTDYPALGVEGWSRYTLSYSVLYATTLNGILYVLGSDGNLYHFNPAYFQDDTAGTPNVYTMSVVWPYVVLGRHTMFQPEATMAYKKQIRGVDLITKNPVSFQAGYDESQPALLTAAMTIGPDDREGGIVPCEVMCDSFSPQITHAVNQDQEIFSVTVWYDVLQQAVG